MGKWKASTVELAQEANIKPEDFKVSGDPLGSRIEVLFLGEQEAAARRVGTLIESLKLGKGFYKPQNVRSPDNQPIQFLLNPDKAACQVRKEILGKALLEIIQKAMPLLEINLQRAEAKIWCEKKPICCVKIISETEARISWMESKRIRYGIAKEDIEPAFAEIVATCVEKWT